MKQRLSLFLLLMAMAVGQAVAADWPVQIAGIQVTDDNHDNVTGPGISAFDASKPYKVWVEKSSTSYSVYLKNVVVDGGSGSGVRTKITGNYTFNVMIQDDDQSLVKGSTAAIYQDGFSEEVWLNVSGALSGKGVLHLESSGKGAAVIATGSRLNLDGKISAKAGEIAFRGNITYCTLLLKSSLELYANATKAAVGYFKSFKDERETVTIKSHATYGRTAYDSDGNVLTKLCCGDVEDYYIDVAGIHVTSLNKDNIMAPGITALDATKDVHISAGQRDGSLTKDDKTCKFHGYELNLYNANIDVTGKGINAINIDTPEASDLGYDELWAYIYPYVYSDGKYLWAPSAIKSDLDGIHATTNLDELYLFYSESDDDKLTIDAGGRGIYTAGSELVIRNGQFLVNSSQAALQGDPDNTKLTLYRTYSKFTSPVGAIRGFNNVKYDYTGYDKGNAEFATADDGNGWAARNADGTLMTEVYVGIPVYPLTVAGIPVTELNCDNITGPGISAIDSEKPYSVSYDSSVSYLNLDNALIDATGTDFHGVESNVNNIRVCGTGVIRSDHDGIHAKGLSFDADELSIEAKENGIYCDDMSALGSIEVSGKACAIFSPSGNGTIGQALLLCKNKELKLVANSDGITLQGFQNLLDNAEGTNAEFVYPDGFTLADSDKDDKGYCARLADGTPVSGALAIAPAYPVWVAGHHLSVLDDLEGGIEADGIKGKVTYDPSNKLLTLEDATITANTEAAPTGIIMKQYDSSDYTNYILLKGNNTIKAKKAGICFNSDINNFEVYGKQGKGGDIPQLTIQSEGDGVTATNGTIYLHSTDDMQLTVYATDAAINGNGKAKVNFSGNCKASLYGEKYGAISRVGGLKLEDGIEIASLTKMETADYYGDGSKTLIVKDSYMPATSVELRKLQYYVQVADVVVSELNELYPIESDHIKGSVRFDKAKGTLTLTNATIDYPEGNGIVIPATSNITQIKLEGSNTIVTDVSGLGLHCEDLPLTVSGPGSLRVQTIAVGDLTIEDCTISDAYVIVLGGGQLNFVNSTLQNGLLGVIRDDGHPGTVNITNSTVTADVPAFFKAWGLKVDEETAIENRGDITITNSYVEAIGTKYGYNGTESDASTLTINNSTVKLSVSGDDAVATAKGYNLTLKGDVELTGKGSEFNLTENPGTKAFEVRDYGTPNLTKKALTFEVPPYYKSYGITVGATTVGGLNCTDVKDESIKGGKVSYDEKTRTLTLDNVQIEGASITIPAGTVRTLLLAGDNSLNGAGATGVAIDAVELLTITSADGEGTLSIDGTNVVTAFNMAGGLTVTNCEVTASAPAGAAMMLYDHELTINNALMKLTGQKSGAILSIRTLQGDAYMSAPEGAYIDAYTGHVMIDVDEKPQLVLTTLTIESSYDFRVGETDITRSNFRDVKDDVVKAGKVSYDPATKTLTLANATLQGPEYGACINAYSWDGTPATIMLEGNNTIKDAGMAIGSSKLVVTSADGKGKLTVTADEGFEAEAVTIKDCTVEMTVEDKGIRAYSSGTLTVDKASLSITCTDKDGGMALSAGKLQLEGGSTLVSPKGAAINTESNALELDGKMVTDLVISGLTPGDVNADGVVNITDVTMTISHILGQNPEGFNAGAADVDSDDKVNITDVTTIIDMILKK